MSEVSANLLTRRSVVRTRPLPLDFPLSRLGQSGSIPALVLPSGGMAVKHRNVATAEQMSSSRNKTGYQTNDPVTSRRIVTVVPRFAPRLHDLRATLP
ncbi:hypothetical protein CSKR_108086 [Clonorchis sinensis]|uniref:Uncharacterized protein n=1 Tax=Clonorchis sinensis TaxID=79923 RepID=A0A3R7C586_CLOSI|nr:hypothetical protein CSKR_108086 [Clonorchis sinensis]